MAIAAGVSVKAASTGTATLTSAAVTSAASGSSFAVGVIHTGAITSITDAKGNVYTTLGTELVGIGNSQPYYKENGTGGASHTFTANLSGSQFVTFFALEITGGATSGSSDKVDRAEDTTDPYTSPAVSPAQADELVVSWAFTDVSSTNYSTNDGSTKQVEHGPIGDTTYKGALSTLVIAALGNRTASWSLTTASTTDVWIATFKAAAAASTNDKPASIAARPGGSMGPRMRRALPQQYPDSPVTPVELTQTPAAPIPAIALGPRRRRSIPQQYADTPVIPVELTQSPAAPFRPGRGPGMGPMSLHRNFARPSLPDATASANVTVALTGVQGTGSVGTLGVQLDVAMTGNAATVSVGTLTPNTDVALTGVAATGSIGTLAPSTDVAMTGVAGTGAVGTLAPTNTVTLSGNEATVTIGTLTPSVAGDVTIALTGVSASVLIGDLAASGGDAAAGTASTGGAKRKIRGPYSDPLVYEAYIKRCIAEREAEKKRPLEVAQLKDALVDVVEERWQTEYDERDALLKENQIIERLITLEKSKRDVRAMLSKQQQIARALADIEDEEELIFAAIHFIEDDYAY